MGARFASSKNALGVCDVCGFQYRIRELRALFVKTRNTNLRACRECWNPSHPQLMLGDKPVNDPQAIRDPRPDTSLGLTGTNSSRNVQWGWNPVGFSTSPYFLLPNNLLCTTALGQVTITTNT